MNVVGPLATPHPVRGVVLRSVGTLEPLQWVTSSGIGGRQ